MATKVRRTSYLPGFYSMRDLNKDADGSCSQYYEDKTLGGNFCNGYQLRTSSVYSEYDREMIKRTMVEHEAVFRKQVYELHRLYRIQKDMMAEIKKGPHTLRFLQSETSQSNSLSSNFPSEGTNWSNYQAPPTIIDRNILPVNFLNEINLQTAPVSNVKGIALDGDIQNSMNKEHQKRTFDLQLPADMYVDCEEVERLEKEIAAESSSVTTLPLDRTQNVDVQNDKKLCFGGAEGPRNLAVHNLVDLNEPVKELCFDRAGGSLSANFIGSKTTSFENQALLSPMRSITSFSCLPSAFLRSSHCDEGSSSHHTHAVEEETRREWQFIHESGQSSTTLSVPCSYKENLSTQSEQIQLTQKPYEISFIDHSKRDTWSKPKLDLSAQLPSLSSNAFSNYTNAASSPLPPSCFKATATENYGNLRNKWQYNSQNLMSDSRLGSNVASYQNGFIQLDYKRHSQCNMNAENWRPERSEKDVHLNQALLNGFLNKKVVVPKATPSNSSGILSWLRRKPDLNASSLAQQELGRRLEKENHVNQFNLLDLSSSSKLRESQTQNQVPDCGQTSKKLFGFIIPEQKNQITDQEQLPTDEHNKKDKQKFPVLESDNSITEEAIKRSRNHINLNSNPNSPDLPIEEEALEIPSIELEATVASGKTDEALIRGAAESIILMSSQKCNNHSDDTFKALHCLAEVASSNAEAEMDPFELETLELNETKPEEFCCRSSYQQDQNVDDNRKSSIASLLFTKPRRGQGKKRRPRREFQRDILPSLASLTRQEVTSDLQTIGGLMKASGHCWGPAGVMRRNGGRGSSSRGRGGGRRPRSLVVKVGEVKVTPVTTPNSSEVVGWGRTTRRCRRQRFPAVTDVADPLS